MENNLFYVYNNNVMSHVNHIFQTEPDMAMATICAYLLSKYA